MEDKICYAEDLLKTSSRYVLKTLSRLLEDQQMFAGIIFRQLIVAEDQISSSTYNNTVTRDQIVSQLLIVIGFLAVTLDRVVKSTSNRNSRSDSSLTSNRDSRSNSNSTSQNWIVIQILIEFRLLIISRDPIVIRLL